MDGSLRHFRHRTHLLNTNILKWSDFDSTIKEVIVCTKHSPNEFTVCDVALPDVKFAVSQMESVRFVHKPYEGTLVVNDSAESSLLFTEGVLAAIAKQASSAGPS